jgi:hypothetical protein
MSLCVCARFCIRACVCLCAYLFWPAQRHSSMHLFILSPHHVIVGKHIHNKSSVIRFHCGRMHMQSSTCTSRKLKQYQTFE